MRLESFSSGGLGGDGDGTSDAGAGGNAVGGVTAQDAAGSEIDIVVGIRAGDGGEAKGNGDGGDGGTGSAVFHVAAATGEITVADSAALDFETTQSFTLDITATDSGSPNLSGSGTVTIEIPENVMAELDRIFPIPSE